MRNWTLGRRRRLVRRYGRELSRALAGSRSRCVRPVAPQLRASLPRGGPVVSGLFIPVPGVWRRAGGRDAFRRRPVGLRPLHHSASFALLGHVGRIHVRQPSPVAGPKPSFLLFLTQVGSPKNDRWESTAGQLSRRAFKGGRLVGNHMLQGVW